MKCLADSIRMMLAIVFLTTVATQTVQAIEFDHAKLEQIGARMAQFVEEQQIAGAVTLVGTRDNVVHHAAIGYANNELRREMRPDTVFRIASMTKPITAAAVMILVDEGKVAVEDPVEKYLPEFQGQMLLDRREGDRVVLKKPHRPITVRDLLTHTAGVAGFPPGMRDLYSRRDRTLGEAVAMSSQQPLQFEPGSRWSYCNQGIDTLGHLVELVSGEPYAEFLAAHIFEPLGMRETAIFPGKELLARNASIYDRKEGRLVAVEYPLIGDPRGAKHPIPAGGLFSTAADLAKFYQMTLNGGSAGDKRILSQASLAEMTRLQTGDLPCGFTPGMGFGFGFAHVKEPLGVTAMLSPGTYGHGGAFGTQGWIDPQRGVFFVLLIQRVSLANGDASEMRHEFQRLAVEAIR
ncbi:MAG: beta-lactamase family protein [Planctomycetales bacterium]|nr:beta-lactamase family protein [Planctomycetales bacterium]